MFGCGEVWWGFSVEAEKGELGKEDQDSGFDGRYKKSYKRQAVILPFTR